VLQKLPQGGHKVEPQRPLYVLVAFVNFLVTLGVENQMHGFLMVFNKSFASEKILKP